jgi:hypothetical protein
MAISFNSIGHALASIYTEVVAGVKKVEGVEKTVETVTAAIPVYGPLGLTVEKAAFAALGELGAVLAAGGDAVKAKLADAGLDQNVVATVEALLAGGVQVATLIKAL